MSMDTRTEAVRFSFTSQLGEAISGRFRPETQLPFPPKHRSTLEEWATKELHAESIIPLSHPVHGTVTRGVWRPGLLFETDIQYAMDTTVEEEVAAERALQILVQMLSDILLFVEPDSTGTKAYGHKTRDLLILACTEVENTFQFYLTKVARLPSKDYGTGDYIPAKGSSPPCGVRCVYRPQSSLEVMFPFATWDKAVPTKSIEWYHAYNCVKHNRTDNFHLATLGQCIRAVAANIVLFCVRFGPYLLLDGKGPLTVDTAFV